MLHVEVVVDSPCRISRRTAQDAFAWVSIGLMPRRYGDVCRSQYRAVRGVVAELSTMQGSALIEAAELVDLVPDCNSLSNC